MCLFIFLSLYFSIICCLFLFDSSFIALLSCSISSVIFSLSVLKFSSDNTSLSVSTSSGSSSLFVSNSSSRNASLFASKSSSGVSLIISPFCSGSSDSDFLSCSSSPTSPTSEVLTPSVNSVYFSWSSDDGFSPSVKENTSSAVSSNVVFCSSTLFANVIFKEMQIRIPLLQFAG